MSCSEITAAAQELRGRGWCLLSVTEQQCDVIEAANGCAAEFFALPLAAKRSLRRAAACSDQSSYVNVQGEPSAGKARAVATAGVGFLSSPAREWFHLAADPATLGKMRWPSEAFGQAMLQLLRILEDTCTAVLHVLGKQSAVAGRHIAMMTADKERWGDPSVLDLFSYSRGTNASSQSDEGPRASQYAMSSHTDPGLLTITPCSAIPALELQDNLTGDWVDAEHPDVSGVSGTQGNHRLLLFAGDALEDYGCVAVAHRVRCTSEKRLSLVYEMRPWEQDLDTSRDISFFEQTLTNGISLNINTSVWRPELQRQQPQSDHGRKLTDPEEWATKKRRTKSREQT
jgi:isopenicillin N synthase-like dioxygenase